jgi:hypothetical protein
MRNLLPQRFVRSAATLGLLAIAIAPASAELLERNHPRVRAAIAVQREVTPVWMSKPEVLGTAVTLDPSGATAVAVYVDRDAQEAANAVRNIPDQWRGVPVQIRLTDKFEALRKRRRRVPPPTGTPTPPPATDHKSGQPLPIKLGTSGGTVTDRTAFYCCGGTLGGLVQIAGEQYVLSNYHVFEGDTVSGSNGVVAMDGDAIIQPSLLELGCDKDSARAVATLVKRSSLPANNVDCAIAKVTPGVFATDGSILEIGPLSAQTVGAAINQAVKKSGRTTGLTRTVVTGLNATIAVAYDGECGGRTTFTKTFTGQIVVANNNSKFMASGDSGSLMVEDVATNPRAVGLLFAASSSDAVANPIDEVLTFLGATMVGN